MVMTEIIANTSVNNQKVHGEQHTTDDGPVKGNDDTIDINASLKR